MGKRGKKIDKPSWAWYWFNASSKKSCYNNLLVCTRIYSAFDLWKQPRTVLSTDSCKHLVEFMAHNLRSLEALGVFLDKLLLVGHQSREFLFALLCFSAECAAINRSVDSYSFEFVHEVLGNGLAFFLLLQLNDNSLLFVFFPIFLFELLYLILVLRRFLSDKVRSLCFFFHHNFSRLPYFLSDLQT